MSIYTIYKISNSVNGKEYIGFTSKTANQRWSEHCRSALIYYSQTPLHKAIRKYGEKAFVVTELYQSKDRDHTLHVMEPFFISLRESYSKGYNATHGGDGASGRVLSSHHKKKVTSLLLSWSKFQKGKSYEEIYGYHKSEKIKNKISESTKGKKLNLSDSERQRRREFMLENNPVSHGHKDATKQKISETLRKKKVNVGNKNGMRTKPDSRKIIGMKNSKTHVLKNINSGETIEITNMYEWARSIGKNPKTVAVYFSKGKPVGDWLRIDCYS